MKLTCFHNNNLIFKKTLYFHLLIINKEIMTDNSVSTAKHPRGLYVLFFTEMWERFGYYLIIGILFLYLTDTISHGGVGMDTTTAIDLVGNLYCSCLFNTLYRWLNCRPLSGLYEINFYWRVINGSWLFSFICP